MARNPTDAPPRLRRVTAAAFAVLLLATAGWVVAQVLRAPAPIADGGALPALAYRSPGGDGVLAPAPGTPQMVMLFHSRCGHCHYQLGLLDRELDRLSGARLFLVTTEDSLPSREIRERWPRLADAPNVTWATVDAGAWKREFGVTSTPATFVFGRDGRLRRTIRGEAKIDFLLESLHGA